MALKYTLHFWTKVKLKHARDSRATRELSKLGAWEIGS